MGRALADDRRESLFLPAIILPCYSVFRALMAFRNISPYRSSLAAPTPATAANCTCVFGFNRAISLRVLSLKIMYAGIPLLLASCARRMRSRSKRFSSTSAHSSARRDLRLCSIRDPAHRSARQKRGGPCRFPVFSEEVGWSWGKIRQNGQHRQVIIYPGINMPGQQGLNDQLSTALAGFDLCLRGNVEGKRLVALGGASVRRADRSCLVHCDHCLSGGKILGNRDIGRFQDAGIV